jgi:hypothetical protein
MSATSRLQPHQDDTEKAAFQHMLQRHVDLRLLTRAPTMAPLAPKKWLRQNKVHADGLPHCMLMASLITRSGFVRTRCMRST